MRQHPWAFLVGVTLLLLFFAQAVGNLSAQSPVVDEPSHIARAMAYWRVGDLRLQLGHPPLIHALAGLPLLIEPSAPNVAELPGWQNPFDRETLARHALWDPERPADRIVFLARWPVLILAMLLGALIFRWAGERRGVRAAVVALFLLTFDPNLLAHSVLVTTDVGVTFFVLLAIYAFDRWVRQRSNQWLTMAGITLGLALAAKFSAVILVPIVLLIGLILAWRGPRLRGLASLALLLAISAATVWAIYRFEVGQPEHLSIRLPAPKFLDGLTRVQARDQEGRMAFLFGQMTPRGWWYYFPVAFVVKTPLPTLILLGAAILSGLGRLWKQIRRGGLDRQAWSTWILIAVPVLYLGVSLGSSLNIGYRHILPVLPFLFILISASAPPALHPAHSLATQTPDAKSRSGALARVGYLICCAWLIVEAALIYPYHLTYFNEAVGGPDNGSKILADSNVDWGQDVKRLKIWLDANGIDEVYLSLFTGSVPERYGIRALPLPGPYEPPDAHGFTRFAPAPGVYAISASALQGLRLDNPDTFDWFRRQTPTARIGHSLFVYRVDSVPMTEKWIAVCYAPDGPINGEGLRAGLGRPAQSMRSIYFDCRKAWVYVHDDGPGYYVIPARGDPTITETMLQSAMQPIYHDRGDPTLPKDKPGFTIYRWDGKADVLKRLDLLTAPPGGEWDFGPASLVAYGLEGAPFKPGSVMTLWAWWRANSPGEVLLSAYAHVMSGDQLMANDDGLDVPPQMWQPGDLIVQKHLIKLPDHLAPGEYTLHVGLYSVETHLRYPLRADGNVHPRLTTIQVVSK